MGLCKHSATRDAVYAGITRPATLETRGRACHSLILVDLLVSRVEWERAQARAGALGGLFSLLSAEWAVLSALDSHEISRVI